MLTNIPTPNLDPLIGQSQIGDLESATQLLGALPFLSEGDPRFSLCFRPRRFSLSEALVSLCAVPSRSHFDFGPSGDSLRLRI